MTAGAKYHAVALDAPSNADDGYGGTADGWTEQFTARAGIMYLKGGETVQAARLTGTQTAIITLRASAASAAVKTTWRLRDTRLSRVYNVREVKLTDDRKFYELLCESGVAT